MTAKTFKLTNYPVIPPWSQIIEKDPFEYKLRSKEELRKEFEEYPPDFPIKVILVNYPKDKHYATADRSRRVIVLKIKF